VGAAPCLFATLMHLKPQAEPSPGSYFSCCWIT